MRIRNGRKIVAGNEFHALQQYYKRHYEYYKKHTKITHSKSERIRQKGWIFEEVVADSQTSKESIVLP